MIRTNRPANGILALSGTDGQSLSAFRAGDIARVEVLGAAPSGRVRISLSGHVLEASDLRGFATGDEFRARVSVSDGAIILTPIDDLASRPGPADSALARLGLPDTPVIASLVAFFRTVGARLDPALIRSLSLLAARFPGKEVRAAEAAAILAERGIEPDEASVGRLLACLEGAVGAVSGGGDDVEYGNGGGGDGNGDDRPRDERTRLREFLSFVNAKRGSDRHWLVIPFDVSLSGRACRGSVRFLVDLASGSVAETRVTCLEAAHEWDFSLAGGTCAYGMTPECDAVLRERIRVYLGEALARVGVVIASGTIGGMASARFPRVDVRA